jgi:6-phosphofructokinase 1
MGRHAGWIALETGMAGDAAVTLIPEEKYDINQVAAWVKKRFERDQYAIVVVAEGALSTEGDLVTKDSTLDAFGHVKLSGVGEGLAKRLEELTGIESRSVVLGHLQRGGTPVAFDRNLGNRLGLAAADALNDGAFGQMVALHGTNIVRVALESATGVLKTVPAERYREATAFFGA